MPSIEEVLISGGPGETRLALIAEGQVVEFLLYRGEVSPGDVLLGRVVSVNRGINAAFVEIGEPQPAFLSPIDDASEGETVVAQVTAAARSGKGVELSRAISLSGRYLVYTPRRAGLNLSRRIPDDDTRQRLLALLRPALSTGEGLVVRTIAVEAQADTLLAELAALRARWQRIERQQAETPAPASLYAPHPLERVLTEHPSIRHIWVDDPTLLPAIRSLFPKAALLKDAFARYDAEDVLEQALTSVVPLAGGGALIIQPTAGVTVIDIDGGARSPLDANLAAIPEIARQLRLRAIAGHILVDIIPLRDRRSQCRLIAALRQATADDPTPTHVVGTTPLGLIEMTRERRRPSLAENMLTQPSPHRNPVTVGLDGLRALLRETAARPAAALTLVAAPEVIAALRQRPNALTDAATRLGYSPTLVTRPGLELAVIEEQT